MIHDVDESLRALIRRAVASGSGVDISFEAPSREWSAKRTTPTINCYLYDIREDLTRRDVFYEEVRNGTGMVIERRQPPRRFKLSYLLSVWTQRTEDEHRLLSSLLGTFLQADVLPDDVLVGSLVDAGKPVIVSVALPPGEDRSISDVWSALGGELKPSLDLVVVAPFDVGRSLPAGPPVIEEPRISVARPDASAEPAGGGRRGRASAGEGREGEGREGEAPKGGGKGRRGRGASRAPAADDAPAPSAVEVELEELGVPTHTPEGKPLTLPARMNLARPLRAARRRAESDTSSGQDEQARSGAEHQPGRVIRIRGLPRP